MDDLLTTRQLMDLLQFDRTTIYRMLKGGRLPAVRVGGQWRFSRQAIEALVEGRNLPASAGEPPAVDQAAPPASPNTDILPLHCVQPIQEVFAQSAGIGAVTTSLDGVPLTEFSNSCALCNLILASEQGRLRCQASWKKLADTSDERPCLEKCHAGLTYARGWINVGGEPVAMIFGGQFLVGGWRSAESAKRIAQIARDCGLDENSVRKAARGLRAVTRERAEHLLRLLQLAADTFSAIGQERLELFTRLKRVAEIADVAQR